MNYHELAFTDAVKAMQEKIGAGLATLEWKRLPT